MTLDANSEETLTAAKSLILLTLSFLALLPLVCNEGVVHKEYGGQIRASEKN
ncbi:MAG: hypothetical protein WCH34_19125 [Bacteroidota bacterium]